MNRRLYFLIPDKSHALSAVYELTRHGINLDHIHTLANKKVRLQSLPNAGHQFQDPGQRIEDLLWKTNLVIFGLALAGLLFTRVPNVHLDEFRDALAHGEILLMVDVPQTRVAEIEELVHHHHPEATVGGVGWETEVFGF